MNAIELPIREPLIYELTGKMESPSEKWIHPTVALINYELFVMT